MACLGFLVGDMIDSGSGSEVTTMAGKHQGRTHGGTGTGLHGTEP